MKKKNLIFLTKGMLSAFLWIFSFSLFAQNITVSGTVTDVNGEKLTGVTIQVLGTNIGTVTDYDGNYSLKNVPPNTTLQVSYVGMQTQRISVNGRSTIDIVLLEDTELLSELVVTGFGLAQRKESLTSSISVISSKDLSRSVSSTASGSLVGKIPGINFRQPDGRPGASTQIQIRNMGTPLYVIDGVQKDEGQFNNIDFNDIESISVLKDASAAIYGVRAANGVIVVTTKKGARNAKNTVTLNSYYGWQSLYDFPKPATAETYIREMFDKMGNEIDAVAIATPDFAHFPAVMMAMAEGKHVYVEKPLTRTFHESELLLKAAKKYPNVVTQMGNQGHSEANYFQFKAWKEAGIIKDVTAITAHMNNPRRWHGWDPNIKKFPPAEPIPETLDWDTWLMARDYHDYNKDFHYGQWRCWYDFGMGALGDWGAHIIDTAHEFLELGLPEEVTPLRLSGHNDYFYPMSSTIEFKFPKRGNMPPVVITWYDGLDNIPSVPDGYGALELDPNIPPVAGGKIQPAKLNPGKEIYSKELTFKGGSHGSTLSIIPEEKAKEMEKKLPEVPKSPSNHFANFLLACQGKEKTRSPFEVSAPLSQVFCLGVAAQRLNRKIVFDRKTKRVTNDAFADAFLTGEPPRKGWEDFYKI